MSLSRSPEPCGAERRDGGGVRNTLLKFKEEFLGYQLNTYYVLIKCLYKAGDWDLWNEDPHFALKKVQRNWTPGWRVSTHRELQFAAADL